MVDHFDLPVDYFDLPAGHRDLPRKNPAKNLSHAKFVGRVRRANPFPVFGLNRWTDAAFLRLWPLDDWPAVVATHRQAIGWASDAREVISGESRGSF